MDEYLRRLERRAVELGAQEDYHKLAHEYERLGFLAQAANAYENADEWQRAKELRDSLWEPITIPAHPAVIEELAMAEYGSYEDAGSPDPGELTIYSFSNEPVDHVVNILSRSDHHVILNTADEARAVLYALGTGVAGNQWPEESINTQRLEDFNARINNVFINFLSRSGITKHRVHRNGGFLPTYYWGTPMEGRIGSRTNLE